MDDYFNKIKKSSGDTQIRDTQSGYQTLAQVQNIISTVIGDLNNN